MTLTDLILPAWTIFCILVGYFLGRKKDSPVIFPASTSAPESTEFLNDLMEGEND